MKEKIYHLILKVDLGLGLTLDSSFYDPSLLASVGTSCVGLSPRPSAKGFKSDEKGKEKVGFGRKRRSGLCSELGIIWGGSNGGESSSTRPSPMVGSLPEPGPAQNRSSEASTSFAEAILPIMSLVAVVEIISTRSLCSPGSHFSKLTEGVPT